MTSGGPNPGSFLSTEFQPRSSNRSTQVVLRNLVSDTDPKVWGLGFCLVGQNTAPSFRASCGMWAWWTCCLRRLEEDKSTSRVRPRKQRNPSSNRWLTAQLWLQNANAVIRNRCSARGIRYTQHCLMQALTRKTLHIPLSIQTLLKCRVGWGGAQPMQQEQKQLEELFSSSLARMEKRAAIQQKSEPEVSPRPYSPRPQNSGNLPP